MPVISMLIGLPGSGKSTFRKKYFSPLPPVDPEDAYDAPGLTVISTDDLVEAYGAPLGLTYSEAFAACDFKAIERQARERFAAAIARGDNIVVDRTNLSRKSRASWLSQLPAAYGRVGYLFTIEDDLLDRRLTHRAETTGKIIAPGVVRQMQRTYEEPLLSEGFDTLYAERQS